MSDDRATVVIGAGPYGLSVAAHLRERCIPIRVFGKPMEFWRSMPSGMYLKSVWSATTLSDPCGKFSLNRYIAATNLSRQEPIPLQLFIDYADWFQQHPVPDVEPTYVHSIARDSKRFHLDLADGTTLKADKVIIAIGISSFTQIPEYALNLPLPPNCASHTQNTTDFTQFRGRRLVIVGSGQSWLEHAALLHESGADVELISRGPINWVNRQLYYRTGPARHIFYPPRTWALLVSTDYMRSRSSSAAFPKRSAHRLPLVPSAPPARSGCA